MKAPPPAVRKALAQLQAALVATLPESLRGTLTVLGVDGRNLTVAVEGEIARAQTKALLPALLARAHALGVPIEAIDVREAPLRWRAPPPPTLQDAVAKLKDPNFAPKQKQKRRLHFMPAILSQVERLARVNAALLVALPDSLRPHVRFDRYIDGTLVMVVPSPVWAARLRLHQADLLARARALRIPAVEVRTRVALPPADLRTAAPAPPPAPPSEKARAVIVALQTFFAQPVVREPKRETVSETPRDPDYALALADVTARAAMRRIAMRLGLDAEAGCSTKVLQRRRRRPRRRGLRG